ncbi:Phage lysin, N-acetylmuramoyl-L-alanine amidase [Enterococcus sp. 5H]|nr:Phage lysin, N-acetylmuramoyl-L-alanine amidase [Enterococcus sp. 5H]
MASIEAMIKWMSDRQGKVTYSMTSRNGPNSYDCSSAVYYALITGGFLPANTAIGNTDSLYRLEGKLLQSITRQQVQRGDLFVAGHKNGSGGAGGHTGIFTFHDRIIHCNYASNGIAETQAAGRMGDASGLPVYYYRLVNTTSQTSTKTVSLSQNLHGFTSADDAIQGKNVKTSVTAGTYYVFNTFKNATNVTKQSGIPGTWVVIPAVQSESNFQVGQTVTLLPKATHYQTGQAIPSWVKNKKYTISQVKQVKQSNSKQAYLLKEIMSWVLEQDLG